jgi:hypothetical protein
MERLATAPKTSISESAENMDACMTVLLPDLRLFWPGPVSGIFSISGKYA